MLSPIRPRFSSFPTRALLVRAALILTIITIALLASFSQNPNRADGAHPRVVSAPAPNDDRTPSPAPPTADPGQPADPRVNALTWLRVENITFSAPNADHVWRQGTNIDITVTLNHATNANTGSIIGTWDDELKDGFRCSRGGHSVNYATLKQNVSSSTTLVFGCQLNSPARTRVLVAANSMTLKGINNTNRYVNIHPRYMRDSQTHGLAGPTVTGFTTNAAPEDRLWQAGNTVQIKATFSENVTVNSSGGRPYLTAIENVPNGSQAHNYNYASGTATLTFSRTLPSNAHPVDYIRLLPNFFFHGSGYIVAQDDKAMADLSHTARNNALTLVPGCGTPKDDKIWCGQLTAGATGTARGYEQNVAGTLSEDDFDQGSNPHTITEITHNQSNLEIAFAATTTPAFDPDEVRHLIGARQFDFRNAVHSGLLYTWSSVDAIWDTNDQSTVRLVKIPKPHVKRVRVSGDHHGWWYSYNPNAIRIDVKFSENVSVTGSDFGIAL